MKFHEYIRPPHILYKSVHHLIIYKLFKAIELFEIYEPSIKYTRTYKRGNINNNKKKKHCKEEPLVGSQCHDLCLFILSLIPFSLYKRGRD